VWLAIPSLLIDLLTSQFYVTPLSVRIVARCTQYAVSARDWCWLLLCLILEWHAAMQAFFQSVSELKLESSLLFPLL
jgi:hypothetical protein